VPFGAPCRHALQTWEYERIDAAQVENETDCFEMEPNNEVKVGTGVQLLSIVRSPSSSEPTIWFAQVPASCVVSDVTRFVSNVARTKP